MNRFLLYFNLALTLFLLIFLSWFFLFRYPKDNAIFINSLSNKEESQQIDSCGFECMRQIDEAVASLPVSSPEPEMSKPSVTSGTTSAVALTQDQTVYLPLGGPVSTTSTVWYDVPGTEFYLDYTKDYGEGAYANWEASLKVAHGNGATYARLYDATNKIAVNGSEISTTGNSDLVQTESGKLTFWKGRNLYRVQIKSLNGYEATFGSGRVKIRY